MALDKVNSHCSVFLYNFIFLYTNLFITVHHFTIINSTVYTIYDYSKKKS